MLEAIHYSHQGVASSLRRARDVLFWLGMLAQVTDFISNCSTCNEYSHKQSEKLLLNHPISLCRRSKLAIDIFVYYSAIQGYPTFFQCGPNFISSQRRWAAQSCSRRILLQFFNFRPKIQVFSKKKVHHLFSRYNFLLFIQNFRCSLNPRISLLFIDFRPNCLSAITWNSSS